MNQFSISDFWRISVSFLYQFYAVQETHRAALDFS